MQTYNNHANEAPESLVCLLMILFIQIVLPKIKGKKRINKHIHKKKLELSYSKIETDEKK